MTQDLLTPDTVDVQYCSDWLKEQIKVLFARIHMLEANVGRAPERLKVMEEALERIEDPTPSVGRPAFTVDDLRDIATAALVDMQRITDTSKNPGKTNI